MKLPNIQKLFFYVILFLLIPESLLAQVDFDSSNLPIVIIDTNGKEIVDDPRIVADMKIINNVDGRNHLSDPATCYHGKISIEIRGSTSQSFRQKQ